MLRRNRLIWLTWSLRLAMGLGLIIGWPSAGRGLSQPVFAQAQPQAGVCVGEDQHVSLPLNDLGDSAYVRMDGQATDFTGGLYPNGRNLRPPEYEAAGLSLANQIVPVDANGAPDNDAGKIVMLSIGMSNAQQEFQAFMDLANAEADLNPRLVLVNGALGGQTAEKWVDPEARPWAEVEAQLVRYNVSAFQVQVVWIKQTLTRGGDFPDQALTLQADLESILHNLENLFPNLKIAFLSSRTRSYTYERGLSPEPTAFETGFAVKWLIEKQMDGHPDLNFDPTRGDVRAPYLTWGPYLWIDGENPRSDGQVWLAEDLTEDCTHPSAQGQKKVADMLMAFFKTDVLATTWFLAGGSTPARAPTESPTLVVSPTPVDNPLSSTLIPATPTLRPTPVAGQATRPFGNPTLAIIIFGMLLIGMVVVGWLWLRRK